MFGLGGWEIGVLLLLGLLLFGRRLPEVGKNLGKGIVEFKKGIKGVEDEIEQASSSRPSGYQQTSALPRSEPSAPALNPPAPGVATPTADPRVSRADFVD